MKYTLDTMRAVVASYVATLTEYPKALDAAKAARVHAAEIKVAARSCIARVVAQGLMISAGQATIRGVIADGMPDDTRRTVSLSEVWTVTHTHPARDTFIPLWAAGNFTKYAVAAVLKDIRPKPDQYKAVSTAIHNALTNGLSEDDVLKAIATGRKLYQDEQTAPVLAQKVA